MSPDMARNTGELSDLPCMVLQWRVEFSIGRCGGGGGWVGSGQQLVQDGRAGHVMDPSLEYKNKYVM